MSSLAQRVLIGVHNLRPHYCSDTLSTQIGVLSIGSGYEMEQSWESLMARSR
jgi:hypothetical protein